MSACVRRPLNRGWTEAAPRDRRTDGSDDDGRPRLFGGFYVGEGVFGHGLGRLSSSLFFSIFPQPTKLDFGTPTKTEVGRRRREGFAELLFTVERVLNRFQTWYMNQIDLRFPSKNTGVPLRFIFRQTDGQECQAM